MSAITPSTDLYLLKSPIEIDMDNQLNFASEDSQATYFLSLPKILAEDISYQRKDSVIRFPAHIDSILGYNYVMYKNANYGNKWFYAFIEEMTYLNDNVTAIKIKTDPYQTWMFEMQLKPSFVEREHVNNDTIGLHTLNENIDTGEAIINGMSDYNYVTGINNSYVAVLLSDLVYNMWDDTRFTSSKRVYGGVPSGCWMFLVDLSASTGDPTALSNLVKVYDHAGKTDAIVSMFVLPKTYVSNPVSISLEIREGGTAIGNVTGFLMPDSYNAFTLGSYYWTRNTTLDGYTPKNNKMYTYPYNYLMLTNNGGEDIVFHWEDFSSQNANFTLVGSPTQGNSVKLIPTNYKKQDGTPSGYEWGLQGQKLPMVSWNSDFYLNWQAKNGVNSIVGAVNSTMTNFNQRGEEGDRRGMIASMFSGAAATVGRTFNAIQKAVTGEGYVASITPDQAKGNVNAGDVNFASGKSGFSGYKMSVRYDMAQSIDNYFSMYGYKINLLKVPNVTGRRNWNYVKTSDANIEGDIPQMYVQELKEMFNKGVTIWHNPNTFLDYSQSNSII